MADTPDDIAHLTLEHLKYLRASADRTEKSIRDLNFKIVLIQQAVAHHSEQFNWISERLTAIEGGLASQEDTF